MYGRSKVWDALSNNLVNHIWAVAGLFSKFNVMSSSQDEKTPFHLIAHCKDVEEARQILGTPSAPDVEDIGAGFCTL